MAKSWRWPDLEKMREGKTRRKWLDVVDGWISVNDDDVGVASDITCAREKALDGVRPVSGVKILIWCYPLEL